MGSEIAAKSPSLVLAAGGDSLITRRLSTNTEDDFVSVMRLVGSADVAFTNLETTIHDFKGYPAAQSGGAWMVSPPFIADELKRAGFNLLSRANNHTMDWGVEGMLATSEILDRAGLTHAGVGVNLGEARRPAYRDTSKGRVALISASSTFAPWGRAGHGRRDLQGRPGLNPLRYETVCSVEKQYFDLLKRLSTELGLSSGAGARPEEMMLLGARFAVGDETSMEMIVNEGDFQENLGSVREAARQADWVIVSLHTHERGKDNYTPAAFVVKFARACIDSGADVVVMHGAHVLRGVEVYRNRPIFYSLGNFIYQSRSLEKLPEDIYERYGLGLDARPGDAFDLMQQRYLESREPRVDGGAPHLTGSTHSLLAMVTFENRRLSSLRLYPVTLGPEMHRIHSGYPRLVRGELGEKIVRMVAELSRPFGTLVEYVDGVGEADIA